MGTEQNADERNGDERNGDERKRAELPCVRVSRFIALVFGIPLTILGLLWYAYNKNPVFLFNGAFWLVTSLALALTGLFRDHKIKEVLQRNEYFKPSQVNMIPARWIRIRTRGCMTVRFACVLQVGGTETVVRSGIYNVLDSDKVENYDVRVYTDSENRYVVVPFRKKSS